MRALYTVVGTMTKDHSPGLIISWFSSASLTELTKEDGSHRPLAVGDTLQRLKAKALLATVSEDMTRALRPSQLELGTATGLEATVHVIGPRRRTMPSNHGLGERVQPDRQVPLCEVRLVAPALARYCDFCHSNHGFVLECDRLRPLHFALGLHGLISEGRAFAESSSCHHEAAFPHPKKGSNQARNLLFLETDGESFCTAR